MQYRDDTNLSGMVQLFEVETGLGIGTVTGSTNLLKVVTTLFNRTLYELVPFILRAEGTWQFDDLDKTDLPEITADLVADQSQYTLPVSGSAYDGATTGGAILKIHTVSVLNSAGNYQVLRPVDRLELQRKGIDFDEFMPNSGMPAYYDIMANSVFIKPAALAGSVTTTAGLKMLITRETDSFTSADSTKEPGIPEPFHELLVIGAAYRWARMKGLPSVEQLKRDYEEGKMEIQNYFSSRDKDKVTRILRRSMRPKTI